MGEAAVEGIISERQKKRFFTTIFELLIKRINHRTVNKKHWKVWPMPVAFDCFTEIAPAQYFNIPEGESVNGLEKIIKFGQIFANQQTNNANTSGGLPPVSMEIPPPRLPDCEHWPLTVQLDQKRSNRDV